MVIKYLFLDNDQLMYYTEVDITYMEYKNRMKYVNNVKRMAKENFYIFDIYKKKEV